MKSIARRKMSLRWLAGTVIGASILPPQQSVFAQEPGEKARIDKKISSPNSVTEQQMKSYAEARARQFEEQDRMMTLISNGCEILFLVVSACLFNKAIVSLSKARKIEGTHPLLDLRLILWAIAFLVLAFAAPGTINWFFASARDMSYFS